MTSRLICNELVDGSAVVAYTVLAILKPRIIAKSQGVIILYKPIPQNEGMS